MSSMYGDRLKISIFGQSHSSQIGGIADGLPAGIKIDEEKLAQFMARRSPHGNYSTARREPDMVEFASGVVDGFTCGAPLCAVIKNKDVKSGDYSEISQKPRPGHADFPAHIKYKGYEDFRGGGHFSGRLTAPICAIGFICMIWLETQGIKVYAHIKSIAGVADTEIDYANPDEISLRNCESKEFPTISDEAGALMREKISEAKSEADSTGGIIECVVTGMPVGIGHGMFGGIENKISSAIFGIGAVKGIEFGAGFNSAEMRGSEHNDEYYIDENGIVRTKTNNNGGIVGGLSNGMPIVFKVAAKPTPSIGKEQNTINCVKNQPDTLTIKGRHDPCIVPRAVPVVQAMTAISIMDLIL